MFRDCTSLETFESDLSSLSNGSDMFENCTSLTTISVNNLDKLFSGIMMFYGCSALETFDIDLPTADRANYMFCSCSNLKSFNSDLSSLKHGSYMFDNCTSLTTFTSDLASMTHGTAMFYGCKNLTTFTSDLASLTYGQQMFYGCSLNTDSIHNIALTINKSNTNRPTFYLGVNTWAIDEQAQRDYDLINHKGWALTVYNKTDSETQTTFGRPKYAGCTGLDSIKAKEPNYKLSDVDKNGVWFEHLPDLINGNSTDNYTTSMFYSYQTLTKFDADLSSLADGNNMFNGCNKLKSFTSNLCALTNGYAMFYYCNNLESFNSKLNALTNGSSMFVGCKFTTFTSDLSSLTDGTDMFLGCSNLESFTSDLSSLTDGFMMFTSCSKLTSFSSDLPSLTSGNYMFEKCKLNAQSVANIVRTLPTRKSNIYITIGIGCDNTEADQLLFAQECGCDTWQELLDKFTAKKWTAEFQCSGRPTTTYNIRRGETLPIYAKLEEVTDEKHAQYISADGSKFFNIKYFHSTNGSTEGYDVFSSLEEAITTYNVTPKN
jgi:hypothetical protein